MGDDTSRKPETKPIETLLDVSDLYTIHHSDHPNIVLVSKLLEGDNYSTWSRAMRISLSAKNKIEFVEGTVKSPSPTDAKFPLWQRCDDMVLAWILNSVHSDIASSIMHNSNAAEAWNDLKERFSQGNDSRIYQIKREIVEHRQGQQSISNYYTKLKALWDELSSYNKEATCTCGGLEHLNKREEKERVMQFLMGLNDSYSAIRGQILLMQPLPDTRRVYSLILQQEKQVEVSLNRENLNHHAMLATHASDTGNQANQVQKKKCSYCDQGGHVVERCFYLYGFPPGHKFHGKNVKPPNQRRSHANHVKTGQEPNKAIDSSHKPSTSKGPRFTTEEYNQLMALLRKTNDGNQQHFANATGRSYEEDDWPGEAS
ncbi:hypothetical protein ACFX13_019801 [Malus domestica]